MEWASGRARRWGREHIYTYIHHNICNELHGWVYARVSEWEGGQVGYGTCKQLGGWAKEPVSEQGVCVCVCGGGGWVSDWVSDWASDWAGGWVGGGMSEWASKWLGEWLGWWLSERVIQWMESYCKSKL